MPIKLRSLFAAATCLALAHGALAQNTPKPAQDISALESECTAGKSASCDELSYRYGAGRGVTADPAQSARYKLRSCEAGDARACGVYAAKVRLSSPGYPSNDPALVAKYARLGCLGGDGPTCGLASAISNRSNSYNPAQRAEIYRNVCRIGPAEDCERAAYAEGERKNWKSAAELARQACARGMKNSCHNANAYAVRLENSQRAQSAQTAASAQTTARPAQPSRKVSTQITPDMYQPESGRRSNARDNSRSGYESCTKSNGAPGQRYWYYGFDNKRHYGPCI